MITKKTVTVKEIFLAILPKINFQNDSVHIKDGQIISGVINKNFIRK